jgi:alkanesulfonate monooxygenase SsuD/methylene tetrahydromethanopterin reductase-like flavin-dependent oxidoreductase (luciferase family)
MVGKCPHDPVLRENLAALRAYLAHPGTVHNSTSAVTPPPELKTMPLQASPPPWPLKTVP